MEAVQTIARVRREYNTWVANETFEDYALRFAPRSFRKWSAGRVAATAFGSVSFLALEAIGGALMISYGFTNAALAIVAVGLIIFFTALPICYYAARYAIDMDLLARGAGFGYIGSTITSLIYASFTFIFFALESAIMALMFELYFGIPLAWGYLLSSLIVTPLVLYGITLINRLQRVTMAPWVVMSVVPLIFIYVRDPGVFSDWLSFAGYEGNGGGFNALLFGHAATVCFSLIAQVGEQVDFLRFLPERTQQNQRSWWSALLVAGPGWIIPGVAKQLIGALLAFIALQNLIPTARASEPTQMYLVAWLYVFRDPAWALAATTLFVILSQVKINVTNAYAGSLAWSNFFSRLTHSHPGRVVWLCFNVLIAVLLMEIGVFGALKQVLGLYSCVAIAWVGALVADLVINKPLGLSPRTIEYRRAYLHDVNPVGVGSTLIASVLSILAFCGVFGAIAQAFCAGIALAVAMVLAPIIAWLTDGKYYLARTPPEPSTLSKDCVICGNAFEAEDMAQCPAYAGTICSLCCTLDARCHDMCKNPCGARSPARRRWLPWTQGLTDPLYARLQGFLTTYAALLCGVTVLVWTLYYMQVLVQPREGLAGIFFKMWVMFLIVTGVASWWLVLTKESRLVAEEESIRQTALLQQEIGEHRKTDAALQRSKETADRANQAKSRFIASMSHELRTPLNSIIGYAQILQKDPSMPEHRREAVETIRESGEHLLTLVNETLDIARIESGRFKLHPVPTLTAEFISQIVKMFRGAAERKGIVFRLHLPQQLPRVVRMDQQRVRQLLINLIGNAVKFTRRGEVTMQFRYAADVANIDIVDNGPGIAAEDLERIFQPFQRAHNTPYTDDSTGLGLTICRLITEQMGGELSVESRLSHGSTFKLRLYMPELRDTQVPTPVTEVIGYEGPRRHLLLLDDQSAQRAVVRSMLEPLGFTITEAEDAGECLDYLQEVQPDALLLDLAMPGVSGYSLTRVLREERHWRQPIIAISANVFERDRARAMSAGCDGFVPKPVRLHELLEQLQLHMALEWMRPGEIVAPTADICELPIPPPEYLLTIREYARIGYIKGISEEIERLHALDPLFHRCAARLREMARQFRTAEMVAFIEEALKHESSSLQA
jgi:signal transduction histidine kinase/DNA-binding NarL/FixJ family response regulator/purine-cytosine permease-like protein